MIDCKISYDEIDALIRYYDGELKLAMEHKIELNINIQPMGNHDLGWLLMNSYESEIRNIKYKIESLKSLMSDRKIQEESGDLIKEKRSLNCIFMSRKKRERLIQIEIQLDKIREKYKL